MDLNLFVYLFWRAHRKFYRKWVGNWVEVGIKSRMVWNKTRSGTCSIICTSTCDNTCSITCTSTCDNTCTITCDNTCSSTCGFSTPNQWWYCEQPIGRTLISDFTISNSYIYINTNIVLYTILYTVFLGRIPTRDIHITITDSQIQIF